MKKSLQKLAAAFIALLCLPAVVQAAVDDKGYYFTVDECYYVVVENSSTTKEVALTSCDVTGSPTVFTVPETVTHPTTETVFTVAYISPDRYYLKSGVVSPVAYDGTSSGPNGSSAANLASTGGNEGPFYALRNSLTEINLPSTIKSITKRKGMGTGGSADDESTTSTILFGLSKAVTVNVDPANPYIKAYDGVLYTEDGKRLLLYPTCLTATSYTVRAGTEAIAASAFNRGTYENLSAHDYLTTVVLPPSIRTIENFAFDQCKKLSSINIPTLQDLIDAGDADASGNITRGVTIGEEAFYYSSALKNIILPTSITAIGVSAFEYSGLTSIEVPGSVEKIENYVFKNCRAMKTATLNEGTKYIAVEVFAGCFRMTSVALPDGLLTIGKQAFALCNELESMELPSTVTSVGAYAFVYDYSMTSINIPAGTTLGIGVFALCNHLATITVDGGTRYEMDDDGGKLDKGVLYGNSNNVAGTRDELVFFIPQNKIGANNKDLIRQWIVPNSVRKICAGSIGMTGIESLVLPSELTTIQELAFFRYYQSASANEYKDVYLKELTIPAKVTALNLYAFYQPFGDSDYYNPTTYRTFFEKIYFMGVPTTISTTTNLSIYKLQGGSGVSAAAGTIPNSLNNSYTKNNDNLAFYVKNSNLSNSVFNTAKTRVRTFSSDIPLSRLTENGKIITMSRDFDVDFTTASGMKAYVATSFDKANKAYTMREVKYVPSRTGASNDEYHGIIVRQTADEAGTYRIGESDYNSGSQTTTFLDGSDNAIAPSANRLVNVVVNTHVQGKTGEVNNWGLSGGKWLRITNTGKLTPYDRAYLLPTAEENDDMVAAVSSSASSGGEAKVAMIFIDDNFAEVTDIEGIDNLQFTNDNSESVIDHWYSVDGRKLAGKPTEKGVYIHNGRKEVVK